MSGTAALVTSIGAHVDGKEIVPDLGGQLLDRGMTDFGVGAQRADPNAGIVDDGVDATEPRERRLDGMRAGGSVGEIGEDRIETVARARSTAGSAEPVQC
jgi:hypothetical protein